MTDERRNRWIRQGTQHIRGADRAVNILAQVTVNATLTLVAASGSLHHVFQRSCATTKRANSLTLGKS